MSNFLNEYPIFEDNQVLTSSQLNDMVAYLDEQSRITRAQLLGTGIACGLKLKYEKFGSSPNETAKITIDAGMGISSNGLFVNMGTCTYDRYRTYTMPAGVSYPLFMNGNTQKTIYELLMVGEQALPGETVTTLTPANCTDMVVLLFLETVDLDMQSCLGKSCDENGKERVFNLRKLLINKNDLSSYVGSIPFPTKLDLPELVLRRPLFDHTNPGAFSSFTGFSSIYRSTFSAGFLSPQNNKSFYTTLFDALIESYNVFAPLLQNEYNGVNPFNSGPPTAWNDYINGISNIGPNDLGMQYFYDFMNDMVLAYHEFRAYANELLEECCANSGAFTNHLMLGEPALFALNAGGAFRHYFKPSTLVNGQNTKLEATIFYHKRMVLMFRKFDLDIINNQPKNPATPIRITPTIQNSDRLSKRAIPFYYRADEADASLGGLKLWQVWNYNYKVKGLLSKGILPYGYRTQDASQATAKSLSLTPLYYNLDKYDSFKVEGHLGADIDAAKAAIEGIRDTFDLPFKVVKLRLTTNSSNAELMANNSFDDLRADYGRLRSELLVLLGDVKARLRKTGAQPKDDLPELIRLFALGLNAATDKGSVSQPQTGFGNGTTAQINTTAVPVGALNFIGGGNLFQVSDANYNPNATVDLSSYFQSGSNNITININGPQFVDARSITAILSAYDADITALILKINALINNTDDALPFDLANLRIGYNSDNSAMSPVGFIQTYYDVVKRANNIKVEINQLVDMIARNPKLKSTAPLLVNVITYFNQVLGLLDRLIKDNSYKGIIYTFYNLRYRLSKWAENDSALFKNFIKKHPGVVHNGTVKKGGTLVLLSIGAETVINAKTITSSAVVADFSLPYTVTENDLLTTIAPLTTSGQLAIPESTIAPPFYAEFNPGDYAIANDIFVGAHNAGSAYTEIKVVQHLQFPTLTAGERIKIYLVDNTGEQLPYNEFSAGFIVGGYLWGSMPTKNHCYFPNNPASVAYGEVYLIADGWTLPLSAETSLNTRFIYKPTENGEGANSFNGIDSFYYMFEIVDGTGVAKRRSNVAKVTVLVDRTASNLGFTLTPP